MHVATNLSHGSVVCDSATLPHTELIHGLPVVDRVDDGVFDDRCELRAPGVTSGGG